MRSISFALTTEQIRNRSKTVTRRLGWDHLKPGTLLQGVVKGMGLKKGESPEKLAVIVVTDVRREYLDEMENRLRYGAGECRNEGFPEMAGDQFVAMFCRHMGVKPSTEVTRIEFRYVPGGAASPV